MRSVLTVGLLTLLSRVTGLVREATKAHFLGTGMAADAYDVAIRIPNLLRSLVAEGAVSAAIVPVFTRYVGKGEETRTAAEKLLSLWSMLVFVVTLLGVIFSGVIVAACFQGGSFAEPEKLELTTRLTRVLFGYLLLIGLSACLQGILHAHRRFSLPALAPFLFNVVFVLSVWVSAPFLEPDRRIFAFAAGVLLGGAVQLVLMIPAVWRLGVRPRPRWPFDHEGVRKILRLLVPATFGAGIYQVNVMVNTVLAGRFDSDGNVAALNYSSRIMEVVLGVFVFGLNTVSLTEMSRQAEDDDLAGFARTLERLLRLALFITIPAAVGLYLLREDVVAMLFLGGSFDRESLEMTVGALRFHVLGLAFVGCSRGLVSGFYALKDVRTPVRVAALNLVVNLSLAWWLSEGELGFKGIALASSIAAAAQFALLASVLRGRVAALSWAPVVRTAWRSTLAAAVMGLAVWGGELLFSPEDGRVTLAVALLAIILLGAGTYFTVASWLGLDEGAALLAGLRARRAARGHSRSESS